MATTDWLPRGDNELLAWSLNYTAKINLNPVAVGLTALEAASYQTLHDAFAAALAISQSPQTNSTSNTVAKNSAKTALMDDARSTARTVRNFPGITDQQLAELGLNVPDPIPTPVPVPTTAPNIEVMATSGDFIKIRLRDDLNPDSRAKPDGVTSATVFSFIGAQPPSLVSMDAWTFMGNTTRTLNTLDFSAALPGATIWLTSMWANTKAEFGPPTSPVVVQLPGTYQAAA